MVTRKHSGKRAGGQAGNEARNGGTDRRTTITPDTPYGECSERLTAVGGLLALVQFLDLIGFEKAFAAHYVHPKREPKLGGYRMALGILLRLFIGFHRLGHFAYVRTEAMVCGIMRVGRLPAVSTFWRDLTSLGIVQSASLLRLGAALRARVWALCAYAPRRVTVNIDTTVATVYGASEGARTGHTTRGIAARRACDRSCAFWTRPANSCAGRNGVGRRSAARRWPDRFGSFAGSCPSRCGRCTCAATGSASAGRA